MIAKRITTNHHMRPISVVDLFTQHPIQCNADASNSSLPIGFSFPVPACADGLTIAYYTRLNSGQFEGFYAMLTGPVYGDGMNSQYTQGLFSGGLYVNGGFFGYGPRYIYYDSSRWQAVVLRSTQNNGSAAGTVYFNMNDFSQARSQALQGPLYAYVNVYYGRLTDAQIAAPAFPSNADQRYIFDGFSLGDVSVQEQMGTGLDATIYY